MRRRRRALLSHCRCSGVRSRLAAVNAAPGSTTRRIVSASRYRPGSAATASRARRRRASISATPVAGAWSATSVPPPRPLRVCTSPAWRSAAIASRNVERLTRIAAASSRSGGSRSPGPNTPRRIAVASCSTVASKAFAPRTGRSRTVERSRIARRIASPIARHCGQRPRRRCRSRRESSRRRPRPSRVWFQTNVGPFVGPPTAGYERRPAHSRTPTLQIVETCDHRDHDGRSCIVCPRL